MTDLGLPPVPLDCYQGEWTLLELLAGVVEAAMQCGYWDGGAMAPQEDWDLLRVRLDALRRRLDQTQRELSECLAE